MKVNRLWLALCVCVWSAACADPGEEQEATRDEAQTAQDMAGDVGASDAGTEMERPDLDTADQDGADQDEADAAPDMMEQPEGCGADHPKVGWTARLTTRSHGVSGEAVIVDNCTIEVRDFNYDGQGIDVRVYGATGTNYRGGWIMTEDLVRRTRYTGETIVAKMPPERSLDALDSVSVWCVDFAIDFGSGSFKAP